MCNKIEDAKRMEAVIRSLRVRELHKKIVGPADNYVCDHCTDLHGEIDDFVPYPCPTIQKLNGEQ